MGELDRSALLLGLVERASRPDFGRFQAQLRSSGNCARPVRLRGHIETCDVNGRRRVWSTESEPDGVLRKACGNRREAVCPPCAERYRQDAYHLIAAGLKGGKGVPDTIAEHPAVFMTLTAPSFGLVHTRALGPNGQPRRCRQRRDAPRCEHGRALSCGAIHAEDDACLGEPLCPQCFDYRGAVVWNHTLGKLWRYTTIYVRRALASAAGVTEEQLKRQVRPAYAKVTEFQKRGLVHAHVLVRLDRAMPKYREDEVHPPPKRFDAQLLEQALRAAVADVSAPIDTELGGGRVRWGEMLDINPLTTGDARGEIAGYLAKYSTKSTEQAGGLLHRIEPDATEDAPVREHVRSYMRTAFELHATAEKHGAQAKPGGGEPTRHVETNWNPADLDRNEFVHLTDVASIGRANRRDRRASRLGACAHAFGYRGHCLTKSRRYSTTFKQLRTDREAWVHEQILARSRDAAQRALVQAEERIATFEYAGVGHVTAADRYYALAEFARARERRLVGREECCSEPSRVITARRRAIGEAPVGVGESDTEAVHDG